MIERTCGLGRPGTRDMAAARRPPRQAARRRHLRGQAGPSPPCQDRASPCRGCSDMMENDPAPPLPVDPFPASSTGRHGCSSCFSSVSLALVWTLKGAGHGRTRIRARRRAHVVGAAATRRRADDRGLRPGARATRDDRGISRAGGPALAGPALGMFAGALTPSPAPSCPSRSRFLLWRSGTDAGTVRGLHHRLGAYLGSSGGAGLGIADHGPPSSPRCAMSPAFRGRSSRGSSRGRSPPAPASTGDRGGEEG